MAGRVLVVDDILANVKLLEVRLSAECFDVLTAYSGEEALAVLASERVDVVVLDVMMPGMDGFEVCRRIKTSERTLHVPVVMVTALDQARDKVQGLEAGAGIRQVIGGFVAREPSFRMIGDAFMPRLPSG